MNDDDNKFFLAGFTFSKNFLHEKKIIKIEKINSIGISRPGPAKLVGAIFSSVKNIGKPSK